MREPAGHSVRLRAGASARAVPLSASPFDRIPLAVTTWPYAFILTPECVVVLLIALAIFAGLSWATWAVAVACHRSTFASGPDVVADPNYSTVAACAVAAVTLTCVIPFPLGYFAGLIAWASAVYGFLNLPGRRATVLVGYLAAFSVVSRLVVLGVLAALT